MGLRLLRAIAIQESKPTLALRFHDRLQSIGATQPTATANHDDDELADAIATTHPRRAIEIYLTNAQRLIAQTDTRLYPQAVSLLGKIRLLLLPKKKEEWNKLLNQLRSQHDRKTNFLRELDGLNRSRGSSARSRQRRSRTRNTRPS